MGIIGFIKSIFGGLFGIFGNLFKGGEDRSSETRREFDDFRRGERDALKKLGLDRDEIKTTANLDKLFRKLPDMFSENKGAVSREVSKFLPALKRLNKESVRVEEEELRRIIAEWENFKRDIRDLQDVEDRSQLNVLIRVIDSKFDRLLKDIVREAKLDIDEAKNLNDARKKLAAEEGVAEGSSEEILEQDGKAEASTAASEESEVRSKE